MTKDSGFFKRIPHFFLPALLSGILTGTSYIPFRGWALLFCYIPLWLGVLAIAREKNQLLKVFLAGWITQFVLTLIGFNWIFYVSTEFGNLHWSLAAAALLLFASLMHLYIPASLVLGVWLFRRLQITRIFPRLFILALLLALFERIWPSIFEWNLAYTLLWIKFPLFQWADAVGFWGLSTWLLLLQAALGCAWVEFRGAQKSRGFLIAGGTLALLALLTWTGGLRPGLWPAPDQNLRVAVAQGNVGNADKLQSEKRNEYHPYVRGLYTDLTSRQLAEAPADLMIWPETAMPFALDEYFLNRPEQGQLLQSVQRWQTPVITGAYSVSNTKRDHLGYPLTRNAVFYISPEMKFLDKPYFKTNLLVFGEYMPFGEGLPFLYQLLPFVGVYEKGSGPVTAHLHLRDRDLNLGPQICYDSLVPGFTRGLSENGAEILFNVTNDSWFGWWAEPFQHGLMTLARGVEVRRPLVRSTNTGISMAILADGTQLEKSPIDKSWSHTFDIPYRARPPQTFYVRYGHYDWILWLTLLLGLVFYYQEKGAHVRS